MASEFRADLRPDGQVREGSTVYQVPGLLRAESIEQASEMAREACFERWPADNFYMHQSAIMPVDAAFLTECLEAYSKGLLVVSDEEPQCFNYKK